MDLIKSSPNLEITTYISLSGAITERSALGGTGSPEPRKPCWQKPCWQMHAHGLHGCAGVSARGAPLRKRTCHYYRHYYYYCSYCYVTIIIIIIIIIRLSSLLSLSPANPPSCSDPFSALPSPGAF